MFFPLLTILQLLRNLFESLWRPLQDALKFPALLEHRHPVLLPECEEVPGSRSAPHVPGEPRGPGEAGRPQPWGRGVGRVLECFNAEKSEGGL